MKAERRGGLGRAVEGRAAVTPWREQPHLFSPREGGGNSPLSAPRSLRTANCSGTTVKGIDMPLY